MEDKKQKLPRSIRTRGSTIMNRQANHNGDIIVREIVKRT